MSLARIAVQANAASGTKRAARGRSALHPVGLGNQAMFRLPARQAPNLTVDWPCLGDEYASDPAAEGSRTSFAPLSPSAGGAEAEAIRQATIENGGAAAITPSASAAALDKVHIREDASADRSARLLRADAVAVGNQILFRHDRYAPSTERGRALIAHEVAHVVHQSQTGRPRPQRLVAGDVLSVQFTQAMAEAMSDDELSQQMQLLRVHLQSEPDDAGAQENLAVLENLAYIRQGTAHEAAPSAAAPQQATQPAAAGPGVAPGPPSKTAGGALTTGEKVLIGVLIGAAIVGGIALIALSGGTAAPAVIVGLEAAGDVAVSTELAQVQQSSAKR